MSEAPPPFLAALGFAETPQDVDERALRRAYARHLKLIDVEAEPERFQALREALDQALRWLSFHERQRQAAAAAVETQVAAPAAATATADAVPAAQAPAPPAGPGAEEIGAAVFASFHPHVAAFEDHFAAREALDRALADERLLGIDARTFFEWNVARLLANGWHAGHEHLLDPATDAFDWASDHARLAHFGQVGALLSAAIRDSTTFHQLAPPQISAMNRLITRIRAAAPPDTQQLREEVQQLQWLVQRVPNWLRIVAPVEPVNQRFEMWRQAPPAQPEPMPRFVSRKPASALGPGALVMTVLMVLVGLANVAGRMPKRPPTPDARLAQSPQADAELARRQKQAEALLADITAARPAPPGN